MKAELIVQFLTGIGAQQISEPSSKGWISCCCPFARWRHGGGTDSSPSFAIKIADNGPSGFNCYSCETHGSGLINVVWQLSSLSGESYTDMFALVREGDLYVPRERGDPVVAAKRRKKRVAVVAELREREGKVGDDQSSMFGVADVERETMDESELSKFRKAHHPYMRDRGFTKETCKAWGLLVDRTKHGDRIVFPVRDINQRLLAFSRRMTWDRPRCQYCGFTSPDLKWGVKKNKTTGKGGCPSCGKWVWPKYLHSKGYKRNLYLYGEHMLDKGHRKGVIVEGNLDPIRLWQLGIRNAVATLGSNVGTGRPDPVAGRPGQQLWRVGQMFDEVLLLADGDKAGAAWADQISKHFHGRMTHVIARQCPSGYDPGDLDTEKLLKLIGEFDVQRLNFHL